MISRNVSVTILVDGSSQTGFVETFFIQRGIFVEVNFLVLSLMYYFGTEAQVVSEFSFRKRQAEVEFELKVFFLNVFLLFGHFFQAEIIVQIHG